MAGSGQVVRAAGLVLVLNLISRFLGYVRDAVIAHQFGATAQTDAYLVAFTIPYLVEAVLGLALVTVIVPVISRYLVEEEPEQAWLVSSSVLNLSLVGLALLTALGMAGAPFLVRLQAPGFSPEMVALSASLTRIMFPSLVVMGVGMLVTGVLNAQHVFSWPALAPAVNNLVVIAGVLFLGSSWGIEGLAVATFLGVVAFLMFQLPPLARRGFRYRWILDWRNPAVARVGREIWPITLAVAVNQIYVVLNRFFASGMEVGSISALNYAYRLMNLPLGIFAAAVATVIFPTLAQQAARGESHSLESTLFKGLGMMSLVTVPAAVGMIVLRQPLVALLFQRGAFDYQATVMTAAALLFYSLGLWGWSANMVLTRAYYALGDVKTPVLTGAVSIVLNLVLSLLLLPPLSFGGLALANSLAATANTLLLFGGLTRRLHLAGRSQFYVSLGKITAASAVMGLATSLAARITSRLVPAATSWGQAEVLAAGTVVGIVVFLIAVLLLRVEEAGEVGKIFLPGRRLKEGAIE